MIGYHLPREPVPRYLLSDISYPDPKYHSTSSVPKYQIPFWDPSGSVLFSVFGGGGGVCCSACCVLIAAMDCLAISAKFIGNQIDYGIVGPGIYSLATLCANMYMCNFSKLPDPIETFKKKLSDRQDDARFKRVLCASDKKFKVKEDVNFYIINLETQSYDCKLWKLSGLPCKHVMAVITTTRNNPSGFVHPYLKKDAYLRTYNRVIQLILDQEQWPHIEHNTILPPVKKRKPGGPKKNRKMAPEETRKFKISGGVKCRGYGEWVIM
ncbi:hypothetical protein Ddye_012898 [Dipteronia dyeriana]|uniref:SWIM-type domain-containing protein n=1 Tax=Dipteronia dyeriana TaxID=168575 RepID=A0AAD9X5E7_9ROSI|nr:hypothetical protein Ddye_012898 [Dipteronia dyeriana]